MAAVERQVGPITTLLADGGPTSNATLMQLQADTSGRRVQRALDRDLSALGVAHLAGLTVGVWDEDALERLPRRRESYEPREEPAARGHRVEAWHDAVARARHRPQTGEPHPAPGPES